MRSGRDDLDCLGVTRMVPVRRVVVVPRPCIRSWWKMTPSRRRSSSSTPQKQPPAQDRGLALLFCIRPSLKHRAGCSTPTGQIGVGSCRSARSCSGTARASVPGSPYRWARAGRAARAAARGRSGDPRARARRRAGRRRGRRGARRAVRRDRRGAHRRARAARGSRGRGRPADDRSQPRRAATGWTRWRSRRRARRPRTRWRTARRGARRRSRT